MNSKLWVLVVVGLLILPSSSAFAQIRHYRATVETSHWQLDPASNPLSCRLVHQIDRYGSAEFTSQAAKQLTLQFSLQMRLLPDTYAQAGVYTMAPQWMPGQPSRLLTQLDLKQQFQPELPKKMAWTLLSELEKGFWPTFAYQDWYNQHDAIMVSLHATNFMPAYQDFVECHAKLLPFNLTDIAFTILTFKPNSQVLTRYAQKRLDMIAQYLEHDNALSLVLIDSHTDAIMPSTSQKDIAQLRAQTIQLFFADKGIDPTRIEVQSHADKRTIAPEQVLLKGYNRRVVVQLSKAP